MKRLILLSFLSLSIMLTGCNGDREEWEPVSPLNTTSLMKEYVVSDNYEQFKTLLMDGYDEEKAEEMYAAVKKVADESAGIETFTLVSFDNGKTLLVHLTPSLATNGDKVLIQDIIEVPEELRAFIEGSLNSKYNK